MESSPLPMLGTATSCDKRTWHYNIPSSQCNLRQILLHQLHVQHTIEGRRASSSSTMCRSGRRLTAWTRSGYGRWRCTPPCPMPSRWWLPTRRIWCVASLGRAHKSCLILIWWLIFGRPWAKLSDSVLSASRVCVIASEEGDMNRFIPHLRLNPQNKHTFAAGRQAPGVQGRGHRVCKKARRAARGDQRQGQRRRGPGL